MVALVLLLDISQGILGTTLVKLVDSDQVRKVQHIDLLQLGSGAVFWRHHIERYVTVIYDLGVTLAYTRRL